MDSENITNYTNSTDSAGRTTFSDDYVAGACFLITAIWGLLGYAIVLPAIWSSKKLRHPCYSIIFSLGISDSASLIAWVLVGVHTVTHASLIPDLIIRHSLCVLVVGWGSLTVHIGVLGINRYMAICATEKHDKAFTKKKLIFIFIGCWIYAIFVHAFPTFLPPHMGYVLDGYAAVWDNPTITDYYFVEDISWCSFIFSLNVVCYAAIIVRYRQIRKQITEMPASAVNARMRQFRLALQCMIRCFSFFFYDLLYYVIGYITANIWLTFICSTYLWAFNNALSPWVNLAFDRQLRTVVKKWFSKNVSDKTKQHQPASVFFLVTSKILNKGDVSHSGYK